MSDKNPSISHGEGMPTPPQAAEPVDHCCKMTWRYSPGSRKCLTCGRPIYAAPSPQTTLTQDEIMRLHDEAVNRAVAVHAGERPCNVSDYRAALAAAVGRLVAMCEAHKSDALHLRDRRDYWLERAEKAERERDELKECVRQGCVGGEYVLRSEQLEELLRQALNAWTGDGPAIELDRIRAALASDDVPYAVRKKLAIKAEHEKAERDAAACRALLSTFVEEETDADRWPNAWAPDFVARVTEQIEKGKTVVFVKDEPTRQE